MCVCFRYSDHRLHTGSVPSHRSLRLAPRHVLLLRLGPGGLHHLHCGYTHKHTHTSLTHTDLIHRPHRAPLWGSDTHSFTLSPFVFVAFSLPHSLLSIYLTRLLCLSLSFLMSFSSGSLSINFHPLFLLFFLSLSVSLTLLSHTLCSFLLPYLALVLSDFFYHSFCLFSSLSLSVSLFLWEIVCSFSPTKSHSVLSLNLYCSN